MKIMGCELLYSGRCPTAGRRRWIARIGFGGRRPSRVVAQEAEGLTKSKIARLYLYQLQVAPSDRRKGVTR